MFFKSDVGLLFFSLSRLLSVFNLLKHTLIFFFINLSLAFHDYIADAHKYDRHKDDNQSVTMGGNIRVFRNGNVIAAPSSVAIM